MVGEGIKTLKSIQFRLIYIFVLMTSALMVIAAISINNSVQSSYYNTFKTRIEKGFDEWRLNENPTKEEIKHYLRRFFENAVTAVGYSNLLK